MPNGSLERGRRHTCHGHIGVHSFSSTIVAPGAAHSPTLTGTADINATGNILNNQLLGNSGNNLLNGGQGIELVIGAESRGQAAAWYRDRGSRRQSATRTG